MPGGTVGGTVETPITKPFFLKNATVPPRLLKNSSSSSTMPFPSDDIVELQRKADFFSSLHRIVAFLPLALAGLALPVLTPSLRPPANSEVRCSANNGTRPGKLPSRSVGRQLSRWRGSIEVAQEVTASAREESFLADALNLCEGVVPPVFSVPSSD